MDSPVWWLALRSSRAAAFFRQGLAARTRRGAAVCIDLPVRTRAIVIESYPAPDCGGLPAPGAVVDAFVATYAARTQPLRRNAHDRNGFCRGLRECSRPGNLPRFDRALRAQRPRAARRDRGRR